MSTQYETILYDMRDGIAEIRLNRPQRLNAVVQQLYDELNDALGQAEADPDARVVLLTGEGRAFCVGADLKEHKARAHGLRSPPVSARRADRLQALAADRKDR